jgi:hypothetical protein
MSQDRFIFETVDFQNGANTINNYVDNYNAVNNAAVTGNTFKFKSDYDRMKNLLGGSGQTRTSGYYDGLYATVYNLTVSNPTVPSSNGPGNSGWGAQTGYGPIDPVLINDSYLYSKARGTDNVGVQIAGYLYSPTATTARLQTLSDDGTVVYFNGSKVIDDWTYKASGATTTTSALLTVNAGYNPVRILYFEGSNNSQFAFSYALSSNAYTGNLKCNFFYNYNQM